MKSAIENTVNEKIDEEENELTGKEDEITKMIENYEAGTFDSERDSIEPMNNISVCNYILDLLANDN